MVIRINDKNQNYNNVTKLLVKPKENKVYKINNTLEVLPTICENHRILVLDSNGDLYYDSMDVEEYKPIESGFIILV